jgi:hypothetical protein
VPMSLMPCFDQGQAQAEGILIGRLLAGYGEIETQVCMCLIVVEGIIDLPIRTIFGERGAERRIKTARKSLESDYERAGLLASLLRALADMDHCREIRNQYSHCQWFWTVQDGLCFQNLENLAKQQTAILSVTANKFQIDVPLLTAQEEFFWYVKQCFMHLETAYRAWDQQQARGRAVGPPSYVYPMPPAVLRPPLHK